MKRLAWVVLAALASCAPEAQPPAPAARPSQVQPPASPPRLDHEGRVLPAVPSIGGPAMFDTPEADRILAAMQVFPNDNPWNEDISERPIHPDSSKMVAAVGADKKFRYNQDMAFILVPPDQPRIPVRLTQYTDESDPGPYPVPDNAPIEGWPLSVEGQTLEQIQRVGKGDRHLIVVEPVGMTLTEFFVARRTDAGWTASCAARFDLASNRLRPKGWTSADAGGLPIFPAVVRFDECERGMVGHAMRVTIRRTRKSYVYPATHHAGHGNDPAWPRMGERFRLRKDFDVSSYPPHVQAILKGLKKYGMIVADNGIEWAISVAPDRRLKGLETLNERPLRGKDFEVVVTTGEAEGPRAAPR